MFFNKDWPSSRKKDAELGGRIRDLSAAGKQKNNQPG